MPIMPHNFEKHGGIAYYCRMKLRKVFAIAFAIGTVITAIGSGEMKQPWIGEPAPLFNLSALDSNSVSLAHLRGKVVVLHFGTGW